DDGTRLDAPRGASVAVMPPLSAHVRLALSAAAFAAGCAPGQPAVRGHAQARHLLTGILAVRDCSVVQALAEARPGLLDALRKRIDQDVVAGEFSAELASDQRRRLDL